MAAQDRPLPTPDEISRPFWEATQRHELLVQRCHDCGHYVFIPQVACTRCLSEDLEWTPSSGRGRLYTFSVVWQAPLAAFDVPYVTGVVELEEGYFMLTNIVDCAPEDVHCDLPVEVVFEDVTAEITLPKFRLRTF